MKSKLHITVLSLLAVLSFMMTTVPASAATLFSNGPPAGNIYGWEIDSGFVVSDSFGFNGAAGSFTVGLWVLPGEKPSSVEWSVTSAEFGGTTYGSGTYSFAPADLLLLSLKGTTTIGFGGTSGTPCPVPGCDIYAATVNINGGLALNGGIYWLNLQNATTAAGGPVGWDENNGTASLASQNAIGTIGSEDPDFFGTSASGSTPEPSSLALFGSGVLGLGTLLRRRFLG